MRVYKLLAEISGQAWYQGAMATALDLANTSQEELQVRPVKALSSSSDYYQPGNTA